MNKASIVSAATEAHRFLRRVDRYLLRIEKDSHFAKYNGITGYRETAAVRRASLDLTRALAEMRNGGHRFAKQEGGRNG